LFRKEDYRFQIDKQKTQRWVFCIFSHEISVRFQFPQAIAKYYNKFTPSVKNSSFGKHVAKTLNASTKGSFAPSFSLPDINGKNLTLYDFKRKYIVLDFWGTWCVSCVKGFPKLKDYYSKYNDKIEFIGIDCQDNVESMEEGNNKI
jgi:thiol-disulfide isomerase/thioredoxin